jgi:phosphate transport system substrate-binding protein
MIKALLVLSFLMSSTALAAKGKLRGEVRVDGSSTVFPITEAVAEEFSKVQPRVRVPVGASGTGGGFKKFVKKETDINDASRQIKASEIAKAKAANVTYTEFPVAYDGISIVVNKKNTWANNITVAELKKIWQPGSTVTKWSDVRKGWPDKPIRLYGPGTDSGTFDYFTEAINGKSHVSRSNYTKSEDDNVLVQGIAGDEGSLGYFGFAYYSQNKDKIRSVPVDNGKGPVSPTLETINNGTYAPLSRPVFIYVRNDSAKRPEVKAFVTFYLEQAKTLAAEVGYVPLRDEEYKKSQETFNKLVK